MNYIEMAQAHVAELYPLIVYRKPKLTQLAYGAILGTWAISVQGVARYILNKDMEVATGVMPSDVTRSWVKDTVNLPIKLRREQVEAKNYPLPLYSKRGLHGDCSYVDITAAYLSILRMGYDLAYLHGRYIGVNPRSIQNEIPNNKMSYAIAIAMSNSRRTNISVLGKEGVYVHKGFNAFSNPCLYRLAADTLASIASEALRIFGSQICYINTDGFIIATRHADKLIDLIASWGFHSRVKYQGETEIFGVAAWKIGSKRTRRLDAHALDFLSTMPDLSQSLWLKRRVTK